VLKTLLATVQVHRGRDEDEVVVMDRLGVEAGVVAEVEADGADHMEEVEVAMEEALAVAEVGVKDEEDEAGDLSVEEAKDGEVEVEVPAHGALVVTVNGEQVLDMEDEVEVVLDMEDEEGAVPGTEDEGEDSVRDMEDEVGVQEAPDMEDEVVLHEVPDMEVEGELLMLDMEEEGEAGRPNKSTLVLSLTP